MVCGTAYTTPPLFLSDAFHEEQVVVGVGVSVGVGLGLLPFFHYSYSFFKTLKTEKNRREVLTVKMSMLELWWTGS